MIDNGYAFDGPHWEFSDNPAQGFYFRPMVYNGARTLDDFNPWLRRIQEAPPELFDGILRDLPRSWLGAEDEAGVEPLIERLYRRRSRVAELIEASATARPSCFTAWSTA